jgi:hypothetical protein
MSRFNDYDLYIQNAIQSWNCPGVALAVIHSDQVLHQSVFGLRDIELGFDRRAAWRICYPN